MKETKLDAKAFLLRAMSWPKSKWTTAVSDRYLMSAFGEFMCCRIAQKINKPNVWSKEVSSLASQIHFMMSDDVFLKVKTEKSLLLREVLHDARGLVASEVHQAKNKMSRPDYYEPLWRKIKLLEFDPQEEFESFMKEYLPEYLHLLK